MTRKRLIDRFINALTDAKQRDSTAVAVLGAYVLVWTLYGIIAKGNQDLHPDMTELIAWSRDLAFGFPKHPPFAAVIVRGWFALFPVIDGVYYLLAVSIAATALWIAWVLFADYLNPTKRLVALCLLTFIPFFNFIALKFNVNTVLMPLWAVTTFWFLRSYRTCSTTYAALAGVAAAFCMVTKYWSLFLVMGLVVAALFDPRRKIYFRSAAPWITVLTGVAVMSPHIGWLEKHDFSPMQYAMLTHGGHSFGDAAWAALRYCLDSMAYASVPIAIILLISRPSLKAVADTVWPAERERRLVAVAFWTTLLLPIVPAVTWGIDINGIWSMSGWTLLPVLLLSPRSLRIPTVLVRWIVGSAVVLPLAMLIAAPVIALANQARGLRTDLTQAKMLTEQVEAAWQAATPSPLRYVGGDLAYSVVAYAHDRPLVLAELPRPSAARLRRTGMVLICYAEEVLCRGANKAARSNPNSRKIEVELARSYFGIAGQSQKYAIFVIPPVSTSQPD